MELANKDVMDWEDIKISRTDLNLVAQSNLTAQNIINETMQQLYRSIKNGSVPKSAGCFSCSL